MLYCWDGKITKCEHNSHGISRMWKEAAGSRRPLVVLFGYFILGHRGNIWDETPDGDCTYCCRNPGSKLRQLSLCPELIIVILILLL